MQIDCYGFDATSIHFQRRKLHPYIIKNDGSVYYICFSDADKRPIHRITLIEETGETIIEWAYGRWDNAKNLMYYPINRTLEVDNGHRV